MSGKNSTKTQILLTNDDGIQSPGLWAAAEKLETLGFVTVVAPREQYSGAGRSLPSTSDGIITPQQVRVNGKDWTTYSVGGSPAQAVLHGALEIMPALPDLVVSGINFGENMGTGITVSGTVGAALEAAGIGIPALAISLETPIEYHYSLSEEVDFSVAAHFTQLFSQLILAHTFPPDVDILKVDVPWSATVDTPWEITRISRVRLFESDVDKDRDWSKPGGVGYRYSSKMYQAIPGTDVHAVKVKQVVSVTPLSLDMTARIDLGEFERQLRG
jgi:5'-nucleotidase